MYSQLLGLPVSLACLFATNTLRAQNPAADDLLIPVKTAHTVWLLRHAPDGKLAQLYYGPPDQAPKHTEEATASPPPAYPAYGDGFVLEPALRATHADGNTSTDLRFTGAQTHQDADVAETRVELRDPAYPFAVTLCFRAYQAEDVIEQWAEIRHDEPGEVTLHDYASSSLCLPGTRTFLTSFHGDWADEMNPTVEPLTPGIKVLDSKLGVRADQFTAPSFLLSVDTPAQEESGAVIAGSLQWSGSFRLAFEHDTKDGRTRALGGVNPFAAEYHLPAGQVLATPRMTWSYSAGGTGPLARQLHRWARRYALRDGGRVRDVMLNNWEATEFKFDEARLLGLFDGAKEVGADLFLLDDGWFGNRRPRNRDDAGLGDWQVNHQKLPHGLSFLADEARQRGLRFGIWLEPEMVNPASDLFETHPDWAIQQPRRRPDLSRNQLVLDLTRPEVREFSFHVLDDTLTQNPGISYVKWDCNRYLTQPGSPFLSAGRQSHLSVDYGRALYDIMERVEAKHPGVEMMLCSGGGGRVDYGALRHFHEFWPSDNTDPVRRVAMQWNYLQFFPAMTVSAHVTRWGKRPLKLALDVAMSGRLGLDLDLGKSTPEERRFLAAAVALYKKELRDTVQLGDLYRLEAPGTGERVSLNYAAPDGRRGVLFIYQTQAAGGDEGKRRVRVRGLDPARRYRVREVNLPEGVASALPEDGRILDGKTLLETGVTNPCAQPQDSAVVLISEAAEGEPPRPPR